MASGTPPAPEAALARPGAAERGRVSLRLRDGTLAWLRACADAPDEHAEIAVEDARGGVVGRAEYRRVYGPRAALTLTVQDEPSGAGVAEAMIRTIAAIAAQAAISKLLMRVPLSDERLLGLLVDEFGARCSRDISHADVELDVAAV